MKVLRYRWPPVARSRNFCWSGCWNSWSRWELCTCWENFMFFSGKKKQVFGCRLLHLQIIAFRRVLPSTWSMFEVVMTLMGGVIIRLSNSASQGSLLCYISKQDHASAQPPYLLFKISHEIIAPLGAVLVMTPNYSSWAATFRIN